jgi:integrase
MPTILPRTTRSPSMIELDLRLAQPRRRGAQPEARVASRPQAALGARESMCSIAAKRNNCHRHMVGARGDVGGHVAHLRTSRVLCDEDAKPLTPRIVSDHVRRSARRAKLARVGAHVLRHTFCSHLAMRGAPARAIQELAGHSELGTTQRYMHLSPAALEAAIKLLDSPGCSRGDGDILETAGAEQGKR